MRQALNFWVIGGDRRFPALAQALAQDGHTVHTYALPPSPFAVDALTSAGEADCVILPLPVHRGERLNAPLVPQSPGLSQVLSALDPGQLVCAGQVTPELEGAARSRGLHLVDYLDREDLAVANAVPTGEGAIQLAMEELPITLHGARVLLLGAGRLSKVLVRQLQGLGAHVTVAARRCADLAWAQVWGCGVEHISALQGWLCAYDLIINTVPAPVLGREELGELKPECLILDLASSPGGVDFSAADELGLKAIHALSLPGRVAPVTAAAAIRTTIYNILTELGV